MNRKSNNNQNLSNNNQQNMNQRQQGNSQNDLQNLSTKMFSNFGMQRRDMGFNDEFFNNRNFQNDFGDFKNDDELFGG